MGLPKHIEAMMDELITRARCEMYAGKYHTEDARFALVSAITHALDERDARIAELEAALRPFERFAIAAQHRDELLYTIETMIDGKIFSADLRKSDCDLARALLAKGGGK